MAPALLRPFLDLLLLNFPQLGLLVNGGYPAFFTAWQ
jgi:hypothetical protein